MPTDHYPRIPTTIGGFIVGKHDMPEPADRDGRTYPAGKTEATNKAKGNVSSGRPKSDPKHAKD